MMRTEPPDLLHCRTQPPNRYSRRDEPVQLLLSPARDEGTFAPKLLNYNLFQVHLQHGDIVVSAPKALCT